VPETTMKQCVAISLGYGYIWNSIDPPKRSFALTYLLCVRRSCLKWPYDIMFKL